MTVDLRRSHNGGQSALFRRLAGMRRGPDRRALDDRSHGPSPHLFSDGLTPIGCGMTILGRDALDKVRQTRPFANWSGDKRAALHAQVDFCAAHDFQVVGKVLW